MLLFTSLGWGASRPVYICFLYYWTRQIHKQFVNCLIYHLKIICNQQFFVFILVNLPSNSPIWYLAPPADIYHWKQYLSVSFNKGTLCVISRILHVLFTTVSFVFVWSRMNKILKGSDRLNKVVELSMQCCGQII